jgi:hypothetical protein
MITIGIGIISFSGGATAGIATFGIGRQLRKNFEATCRAATAR